MRSKIEQKLVSTSLLLLCRPLFECFVPSIFGFICPPQNCQLKALFDVAVLDRRGNGRLQRELEPKRRNALLELQED